MKWKLKKSNAKSAKSVCVIKVTKNNLTGNFMELNNLGNGEFSFSPDSVGIYRVLNNIDKSTKPIKGCYLVYKQEAESFLRYLSIPDEDVKNISNDNLNKQEFTNNLASEIRSKYEMQ